MRPEGGKGDSEAPGSGNPRSPGIDDTVSAGSVSAGFNPGARLFKLLFLLQVLFVRKQPLLPH